MLESAADCLGGSVGRAWAGEVRRNVGGPLLDGATERDDLGQGARDTVAEGVDQVCMVCRPRVLSSSR